MSLEDACEEASYKFEIFSHNEALFDAFHQWLLVRNKAVPFTVDATLDNLDLLLNTPEFLTSGDTYTYGIFIEIAMKNPSPIVCLFKNVFLQKLPKVQALSVLTFLKAVASLCASQVKLQSSESNELTRIKCSLNGLQSTEIRFDVFSPEMAAEMSILDPQYLQMASLILSLSLRNLVSNFFCDWVETHGVPESKATVFESILLGWNKQAETETVTNKNIETVQNLSRLVAKSNEQPFCAKCGHVGKTLQRCSACQKVFYCGTDCQKVDWPVHKLTCRK